MVVAERSVWVSSRPSREQEAASKSISRLILPARFLPERLTALAEPTYRLIGLAAIESSWRLTAGGQWYSDDRQDDDCISTPRRRAALSPSKMIAWEGPHTPLCRLELFGRRRQPATWHRLSCPHYSSVSLSSFMTFSLTSYRRVQLFRRSYCRCRGWLVLKNHRTVDSTTELKPPQA